MTDTKSTKSKTPAVVEVVVVVNHDDLRRGEAGQVELTDAVRARLDKGYLRLAEDDSETVAGGLRPLGGTVIQGAADRGVLLGVEPGAGGTAAVMRGGSGDQGGTVHTPAG